MRKIKEHFWSPSTRPPVPPVQPVPPVKLGAPRLAARFALDPEGSLKGNGHV